MLVFTENERDFRTVHFLILCSSLKSLAPPDLLCVPFRSKLTQVLAWQPFLVQTTVKFSFKIRGFYSPPHDIFSGIRRYLFYLLDYVTHWSKKLRFVKKKVGRQIGKNFSNVGILSAPQKKIMLHNLSNS